MCFYYLLRWVFDSESHAWLAAPGELDIHISFGEDAEIENSCTKLISAQVITRSDACAALRSIYLPGMRYSAPKPLASLDKNYPLSNAMLVKFFFLSWVSI